MAITTAGSGGYGLGIRAAVAPRPNLAVPRNNASEQALKGPKRHQAVSRYWHTLAPLAGYCRVRSYLVSIRGHHIRAIGAIRNALTGNPWFPTPATADTTAHP